MFGKNHLATAVSASLLILVAIFTGVSAITKVQADEIENADNGNRPETERTGGQTGPDAGDVAEREPEDVLSGESASAHQNNPAVEKRVEFDCGTSNEYDVTLLPTTRSVVFFNEKHCVCGTDAEEAQDLAKKYIYAKKIPADRGAWEFFLGKFDIWDNFDTEFSFREINGLEDGQSIEKTLYCYPVDLLDSYLN